MSKKKGKEEKILKMGFGFLEHICTTKRKQIQKAKQKSNKQAQKPKQNKTKI